MDDYKTMLENAYKQMPEVNKKKERFEIPKTHTFREGKATVLSNLKKIAKALNRNEEHMVKFLLRELGTAGRLEKEQGYFQGNFTRDESDRAIQSYVNHYVSCANCNSYDTHFEKQDRVLLVRCEACGAHKSVRK